MRTRLAGRVVRTLCVAGSLALAACAATAEPPLGGPYGGNGFRLGPTDGGFKNVDATYTAPSPPSMPGVVLGAPGTWTHIFTAYMADGTIGNCTHCHAQMGDAKKSYKWLSDQGYMGSSAPPLTDSSASCISWYGGDMPPGTARTVPAAKAEMDMWAASGGRNN